MGDRLKRSIYKKVKILLKKKKMQNLFFRLIKIIFID
jgi:hypothetical protein